MPSWHVPETFYGLERRKVSTAARKSLNVHLNRTESLLRCPKKNFLGASFFFDRGANKRSLHPPPAAVACVAPGTRRSQVQSTNLITRKILIHQKVNEDFLVAGTGCGCPVDTSARSAEAPTEAAAETLNLRSCQILCGEFAFGHLAALTVHWTVIHYRSAVRFALYLRLIRPSGS